MIENYNKSLKQNNNLIFSNERSSNYLSSNLLGVDKFGQGDIDTKVSETLVTLHNRDKSLL